MGNGVHGEGVEEVEGVVVPPHGPIVEKHMLVSPLPCKKSVHTAGCGSLHSETCNKMLPLHLNETVLLSRNL